MSSIIAEPNKDFPFYQLQFLSPTSNAGGNFFIKCLTKDNASVYFQTPKCYSKQGIVKTGKRMYIDYIFHNNDEVFLEWVETLETLCQKEIYEHREKWFESSLEMHDIENSFTQSLKLFKSGKMYTLRATIPMRLGKCGLKIYDEQENDIEPESIKEKTNLLSILEFQGIKCSSRNFQLEFEVKQMMILNPINIFESFAFSRTKQNLGKTEDVIVKDSVLLETTENMDEDVLEIESKMGDSEFVQDSTEVVEEQIAVEQNSENIHNSKEIESLEVVEMDDMCEVNIPLDENIDEVKIKSRNNVYYQMYQTAKRKAKAAKDLAIAAYLEAKHIKNTYLLEDEEKEDEEWMKSDISSSI